MEHSNSSTGCRRTREHVSIDISPSDEELVTFIRRKMESASSVQCICRVKDSLRIANPKSYIPEKVSIGPYHHANDNLKAMEDHKWRYVHALLDRRTNLEASVDGCVIALKELENRARACYAGKIDFTGKDFLQMMLIDGCFIIELFLKYSFKSLRSQNDPIFNTPGMLFDLRCDLILLENQIPLFILQRLFQLVPIPNQCSLPLAELAFRFFKNMIPGDQQIHRKMFNQEGNHLLDLLRHCLLPSFPRVQPKQAKSEKHLRCATELQGAGIRLKTARIENLLDIKFANGVIEVPPIVVHQYTESFFRNLIALEQCYSESVQYITSYAVLLNSLICTENDVKLLQKKGILTNYDASENEVAKLFEKLCQEVNLNESFYDELCQQVNSYKGISWHVLSKRVKCSYHKNPLLRLVLVVAVLVLVLTLVGTLFSVLAFFLHRF